MWRPQGTMSKLLKLSLQMTCGSPRSQSRPQQLRAGNGCAPGPLHKPSRLLPGAPSAGHPRRPRPRPHGRDLGFRRPFWSLGPHTVQRTQQAPYQCPLGRGAQPLARAALIGRLTAPHSFSATVPPDVITPRLAPVAWETRGAPEGSPPWSSGGSPRELCVRILGCLLSMQIPGAPSRAGAPEPRVGAWAASS